MARPIQCAVEAVAVARRASDVYGENLLLSPTDCLEQCSTTYNETCVGIWHGAPHDYNYGTYDEAVGTFYMTEEEALGSQLKVEYGLSPGSTVDDGAAICTLLLAPCLCSSPTPRSCTPPSA